jgi:hypothetical protein
LEDLKIFLVAFFTGFACELPIFRQVAAVAHGFTPQCVARWMKPDMGSAYISAQRAELAGRV